MCLSPTIRCVGDGENVVERRRGKALAPDPSRSARASSNVELARARARRRFRSVRRKMRGRELLARDVLERRRESAGAPPRRASGPRRTRGRRSVGRSCRARAWRRGRARRADGSRRSSGPSPRSSPSRAAREHDGRAVEAVLEPRRDDADHALMPVGAVQAQRVRVVVGGAGDVARGRPAPRPASSPRPRAARD